MILDEKGRALVMDLCNRALILAVDDNPIVVSSYDVAESLVEEIAKYGAISVDSAVALYSAGSILASAGASSFLERSDELETDEEKDSDAKMKGATVAMGIGVMLTLAAGQALAQSFPEFVTQMFSTVAKSSK